MPNKIEYLECQTCKKRVSTPFIAIGEMVMEASILCPTCLNDVITISKHPAVMATEPTYTFTSKPTVAESEQLKTYFCPDCQGPMAQREGQYGKFWGCTDYPKCRGTRDSKGRSKADRDKWKAENNR